MGYETMPMNINPIPTVDTRINEIRELTAKIVNKEILPQERALATRWRRDASAEEKSASRAVADSIKDKVKKAGLWAPHLPPAYGGAGLSFLEHAYMNEILAYTPGGA